MGDRRTFAGCIVHLETCTALQCSVGTISAAVVFQFLQQFSTSKAIRTMRQAEGCDVSSVLQQPPFVQKLFHSSFLWPPLLSSPVTGIAGLQTLSPQLVGFFFLLRSWGFCEVRPLSAPPKRPLEGHGSKKMPGALTFPLLHLGGDPHFSPPKQLLDTLLLNAPQCPPATKRAAPQPMSWQFFTQLLVRHCLRIVQPKLCKLMSFGGAALVIL